MTQSLTRRGLLVGGLGALGAAAVSAVPAAASHHRHVGLATVQANQRSVKVHPSFPMTKRGLVLATVQNYDSSTAVCAVEVEGDHFEITLTFTPSEDVPVGWLYLER